MKEAPVSRVRIIVIASLLVLCGVALMVYPHMGHVSIQRTHARLIAEYNRIVSQMCQDTLEQYWQTARSYNNNVSGYDLNFAYFTPGSGAVRMPYSIYIQTLNIGPMGMMGYIQIPAIRVRLPILHTSSEEVMDLTVGHLEWTSLPIGGSHTHAALTAHSAWHTHRLFSDLEKLTYGDIFFINVLGETLAYQVDRIVVTLPHQTEYATIMGNGDYVTLMTCYPYAVNTHRLQVRGSRIPYEPGMMNNIASVLPRNMLGIYVVILMGVAACIAIAIASKIVYDERKRKGSVA